MLQAPKKISSKQALKVLHLYSYHFLKKNV